jgi:hypothetical protein
MIFFNEKYCFQKIKLEGEIGDLEKKTFFSIDFLRYQFWCHAFSSARHSIKQHCFDHTRIVMLQNNLKSRHRTFHIRNVVS